MNRKVELLAGAAVMFGSALALCAVCWLNTPVPYVPLVRNVERGDPFVVAPELNTPEHRKSVSRILGEYGFWYKLEPDQVLIRRGLALDCDLLANFTDKAEGGGEGPRE